MAERFFGSVRFFSETLGWGKITRDDTGCDLVLMRTALRATGIEHVVDGDRLSFTIAVRPSDGKESAANVCIEEPNPGRRDIMGRVKASYGDRGFFFIRRDDGGSDIFCDAYAMEAAGLELIQNGDRVVCNLNRQQNGRLSASALRLIERSTANA
jgi:cold shock protein